MPKGYWVARVEVTDLDAYKKYLQANAVPFAKYGAKFIVRAGRYEVVEGRAKSRNVVIEFPSYEAALACYRSPEYAAAMAYRKGAGEADIVVVEGYGGPQPGGP